MILDYDLTSPSNQTLSTGSWNWTALMTSDTHWVNHSNLSEYGNYYLNVTLSYINANGSLIQLDSYQVWIWVDGCGVVPSQAGVYAWQSMYNLQTGDNVTWTASSSCLVLNATMFLDYEVRAPSGALTSSGSINWTANSTYRTDVLTTLTNLGFVGWYWMNVTLSYLDSNGSVVELDDYDVTWYVAQGATGPGCGTDPSYTTLSYTGNQWNMSAGDDLSVAATSNCNLLNQTMILDYDLTSPSNQITSGSWNWTAYSTTDTHWINVSNLSEFGYHYLNISLSYVNSNGSIVEVDSATIWIYIDGCGLDPTQAYVYASRSAWSLQVGDSVTWEATTNCLVLNRPAWIEYEIVDPGNMVIANGSASLGVVNSTYLAQTLVTVANLSSSGWYQTSVALYYLDANSQYTHLDNYSTNWYVASGSTSTGCGHDPTYAYLNVSYPGNLEVGDDLNLMASSYCNLLNETMVLEYDLRSPSNTSISSGSWNWTAYYLSDTHWINYSNLNDVGYHTLHVDLWHIDGNGSWSLLDGVTLWIWVGNATTGGGGCGDDPDWVYLYVWNDLWPQRR